MTTVSFCKYRTRSIRLDRFLFLDPTKLWRRYTMGLNQIKSNQIKSYLNLQVISNWKGAQHKPTKVKNKRYAKQGNQIINELLHISLMKLSITLTLKDLYLRISFANISKKFQSQIKQKYEIKRTGSLFNTQITLKTTFLCQKPKHFKCLNLTLSKTIW